MLIQPEKIRPKDESILLSICIATLNRGDFIAETLNSIVSQLTVDTELLVVDGASKDSTPDVMAKYVQEYSQVRYIQEQENSGFDADFDKAVSYAKGTFCWLMTDDDILVPGAISRVREELVSNNLELLVVDAEVRDINLERILQLSRMFLEKDHYFEQSCDQFLEVAGDQLSFIASVIVRRDTWLKRERNRFYGSLFVHVGVLLQSPPLEGVKVLSEPLIQIRYGNASWTARAFEIWLFIWPNLIWSFEQFSERSKAKVCARYPWKNLMQLLKHRARGSYSTREFENFIENRASGIEKAQAFIVAKIPEPIANFAAVAYVVILSRQSRLGLGDLLDSEHASWASKLLARLLPLSKIGG
ncbi:glycosyltransferase family 2 protein [Marinobacter alexandrii]|uniref:glycosyltransferase family 2 protein n=1 Tax=Marinobacter alexandrii TaxID=2570351 RepID=UPI0032987FB8